MKDCALLGHSPNKEDLSHLPQTIHRGIGLPEILSVIFSTVSQVDLARAARVCRLWSSIALDNLWECIPDIDCLINVYSRLHLRQDQLLYFEDPSNEGRWEPFWAYARRVRIVSACQSDYGPEVIPRLLRHIANPVPRKTFLPNLRSIYFTTSSPEVQSLSIFPLIPATLETLRIQYATAFFESTTLTLIQALTTTSVKGLKAIELCSLPSESRDLRLACTTFVSHQHRLESLHLSSLALTTDDLRRIGELPLLTKLHLHHGGNSARELAEACATIGNLFPYLQKLFLVDNAEGRTDILVMEGLAPCRNLRAAVLRCSLPDPVTAEAIRRLALCWPRLEELVFDPIDPPPTLVGASLAILEELALGWSETVIMAALMFDAREELPQAAAIRGRFKKLEVLGVDYSIVPEDRVAPVAEFIATMCLEPPQICFNGGWDEETKDNWDAVEERVAMILQGEPAYDE